MKLFAVLLALMTVTACGNSLPAGGSTYDAVETTDVQGSGLPAGKPGKLAKLTCVTPQPISPESCRAICQLDADFQSTLACPKDSSGECTDLSALAPACTPFSGKCVCDALLEMGCLQCPDGGIALTVADRKFYAIEAVSAFPAKLDDLGKVVGRVCGAALDPNDPTLPSEPMYANGLEVTANFMSSGLSHPACAKDQDLSVKAGELVNLHPVSASITPGDFQFALRCTQPQTDLASCAGGGQTLYASSVTYKNIADRCVPAQIDATQINVALILDNSGSMKGNVDKVTKKEDADGQYQPVSGSLTSVASDWTGTRFNAALNFVSALNAKDRVIGYVFDENGAHVAASDSFICDSANEPGFDPAFENAPCRPEIDSTCPAPGRCIQDPTQTKDSYNVALPVAECLAFGASTSGRIDLENGIDLKRNGATGRASLWQTVKTAFDLLTSGGAGCAYPLDTVGAKHILVITDGPDTCTDGDDFSYTSFKDATSGKCRTTCAGANIAWRQLLIQMAKAGYPVHVHIVQFQAPGYMDPDPQMMEMACRTDGTYQFINSENFNKASSQEFSDALMRAINRVRGGLSGTWRVGFPWPDVVSALPKGALRALDGDFVFTNAKFASLYSAVHQLSPDSWRFAVNGEEDRRALLRIACASDVDCGGTNTCSTSHCGQGGVCRDAAAPDGKPCGAAGRCHKGACTDPGTCVEAIKP